MPLILLVEDSPTQARAVSGPLEERDYEVEWFQRLAEAIQRTQRRAFDAVILDLHLPDSEGMRTYRSMQEAVPDTPVIVLTSTDDEQLALEMLRSGAQDYLIKGEVTSDWVLRSIRYAVERFAAARRQNQSAHAVVPDRQVHLRIEQVKDVTIVRIETRQLIGGELIEELSSQLFKLVDEQGKRKFVLDCHEVDYISNSVLGQLLVWDKKIRQNEGSMRICNLRREVQDQIKVRKLLAQFDVCIDEETALNNF